MVTDKVDQHQVTTTRASAELETAEVTRLMMETMTRKAKERKSKLEASQPTSALLKIQEEPVSMQAVVSKKSSNNNSSRRTRKQQSSMFLQLLASKAELKITMMVKKSKKELNKLRSPKTDSSNDRRL